MARTRPFLLIFLILLFETSSAGHAEIAGHGAEPPNPAHLLSKMQTRKVLVEFILDYDYGGHNPKHEPRRGKPGNGSKNP